MMYIYNNLSLLIYICDYSPDAEASTVVKRDTAEEYRKLLETTAKLKRPLDVNLETLSKNKLKKLRRNPNKVATILSERPEFVLCSSDSCKNPKVSHWISFQTTFSPRTSNYLEFRTCRLIVEVYL